MAKDKNGNAILPKKTPQNVIDWVNRIELHISVNCLALLSEDSTLEQIKEAFEADRNTLIGIGEDIYENARWNAWSSYESELKSESN
ncbi:MAG: hypothetical protein HRU24_18905 [Gammaproteobacteria bacterium]|nr:hypothetical protein [Gammaproteobacteria bacterium]